MSDTKDVRNENDNITVTMTMNYIRKKNAGTCAIE